MRDLAPGMVVAGYRIDSLVGRGGMGVVYRAIQLELERVVALKVIAPELLDDEDVRTRFLTEARAAASVDHPNVIPVHTAGEDAGVGYIAMRFVAGEDLRSLVRHGGPLDGAEAARMVAQAGAALDAIHRAGFVHRDVKPANLLVDRDGHVYLTDFGLAKVALTHSGRTRTGQWVGTLDYVSPEQIRGGRIDARADVYALGGVLHFALTGRVPFERQGDEAKLWAQLSAPPPVPSDKRPGLPGQFDVAVVRAMAKNPDHRYPSAGDLGRAAQAAAVGRSPTEPERMVARGAAAPGAAPTEPGLAAEASTRTAARFPGQRRRRRRAPLVAAGALLAAVGVAAAVPSMRDDTNDVSRARGATLAPTASPSVTPSPTPTREALPRLAKTISNVGERPAALALAGGDLWITSAREPRLTRVDAATARKRSRRPVVGPDAAMIVAYRGDPWVAMGNARAVLHLDGRTGEVRRRIPVAIVPRRLAVTRHGVWVANSAPEGIFRYDRNSGALLQTIPVPDGVRGMIAGGDALWVVTQTNSKLARLEPGATRVRNWTNLPGTVRSIRFARKALWIVLDGENTVIRVDARNGRYRRGAAGQGPAQAVYAGGRVYVSSQDDNTMVVLDPKTLQPVQDAIPVGYNPGAMVADDRSLWVVGLGDDSLMRIDYR
jgi:YVTN family beta-propeller protein